MVAERLLPVRASVRVEAHLANRALQICVSVPFVMHHLDRSTSAPIGLLLSGGIDSAVLLAELCRCGRTVRPFYVSMGCVWEEPEFVAVNALLREMESDRIEPLIDFSQPAADLYGTHWSTTGNGTPDDTTPDEAVFLWGRNPLLLIKPMLWCQQNGISELAIGTLASNPFEDASKEFLRKFSDAIEIASGVPVRITQPLSELSKVQLMERTAGVPLDLTFSCLAPAGNLHCGRCNKCAERRGAMACLPQGDPTHYASAASATSVAY